jgi:site-specific DNA-methyltransferase (adenine-specific)
MQNELPQMLPTYIAAGDILKEMSKIKRETVDLVICNIDYETKDEFLKKFCKSLIRVLSPKGTIVFFGKEMFTVRVINAMAKYYKYRYVWKKGNTSTGFLNSSLRPLQNHEDIMIFQKAEKANDTTYNPQMTQGAKRYSSIKNLGKEKHSNIYSPHKESLKEDTTDRYPTSVLNYDIDRPIKDVGQKPMALIEFLIRTYSNHDDTVLFPCLDKSGNITIAHALNRGYIGIAANEELKELVENQLDETPIIKEINV